MSAYRIFFRCFLLGFLFMFISMICIGTYVLFFEDEESNYGFYEYHELNDRDLDWPYHKQQPIEPNISQSDVIREEIAYPIILWWYRFTAEHRPRRCGADTCFFTNDRKYLHHPKMKVAMFYGTSLDPRDLPLPRQSHHEWGLLHEESPKNVYLYSHPEIMELFNHTATFKRESDYPLSTLWLKDLASIETKKYLVPTEKKTEYLSKLALVNYVHSDCGAPSDRDHFVDMMQRYIKVDSYGKCRQNKELPKHLEDPLKGMFHEQFYGLIAKYKFTIVAENGICDDYITEKLWRTFTVGSVPIIIGSKKIRDFLPDNHSAILVDDFSSMRELADLLIHLNHSDHDYNKYLQYKHSGVTNQHLIQVLKNREWGVDNPTDRPNFVQATECFVCHRIHDNIRRKERGEPEVTHQASLDHYGCPMPLKFKDSGGDDDLTRVENKHFAYDWIRTKYEAKALKEFWDKDWYNFTNYDLAKRMTQLRTEAGF